MLLEKTSLKVINIQILDRSFSIKCPEDKIEQLMKAAHHLNTHMRKVRESSDSTTFDRMAIMVALNLCHELLFKQPCKDEESHPLDEKRLKKLQQKIEDAICENVIEQLENASHPNKQKENLKNG